MRFFLNFIIKNSSKRLSSSMIVFSKPNEIPNKFNQDLSPLSITEILSSNFSKCNTNMLIDALHICSNKFENELKYFDDTYYNFVENANLHILFLYILTKARFMKSEHVLPFIRSYDIFNLTILDTKCWEIIGRILNNCMNYFSDDDLVEICYHLININSVSKSKETAKEIGIFWERIIIQSPNWFKKLYKLDVITLVYLLHVCRNVDCLRGNVEVTLSAIKESEDFFYRVQDLPVISFLIQTMDKNDVFDEEIVKQSLNVIPEIRLTTHNICDVVDLIWSCGHFVMRFETAKDCAKRLNSIKLKYITDQVKTLNRKLSAKLTKSLFLLGLPIQDLFNCDIDVGKCHEIFDKELIDSIYTMKLVKDPVSFFTHFSRTEFEKINLPNIMKTFYWLTYFQSDQVEFEHLTEYINTISHLKQSLSQFFTVPITEKHELVIEHSRRVIGLVPCHFTDFLYPQASDAYIDLLRRKNDGIEFYKISTADLRGLDNSSKVNEFIARYFPVC